MSWFPLPIFPEGALSASVIVTVWVGIGVVAMTNLRLGWVLSGLVIPGYMVPLLIVKPWAGVVVFGEGIITYLLVWFYSEYLSRFTGWSNFFGRDRFFALVLASVAVRIVSDGWLLPQLGDWLLDHYQLAFDYRSNLHSFGLIIAALIANNFWKTGLARGLWPMFVQVGLTFLIVRYGLMELTNFNLSSLAFMYEDMASSFMATPKAYIIILVTAFIASRLNLFYGWDFSGILIPSLLALTWYEPFKIATTLVEAVIILWLSQWALALPMFRNVTMEGARKLLLFFNVGFFYKFVLSWALVLCAPQIKVSDWFGFGYLLATLIALKIHDKGIFARLTRATLQTSLLGVAAASFIGFLLVLLPDPQWHDPAADAQAKLGPIQRDGRPLQQVLGADKTGFYAASLGDAMTTPLPREIDAFAYGVRKLLQYRAEPNAAASDAMLDAARRSLLAANYELSIVSSEYLLLRERTPLHHWGSYALHLGSSSPLLVEVPAPVDEAGAYEAGAALFTRFKGSAFAAAGAARHANPDGSADVLNAPQTMFQAFHRELALGEVLQVRSHAGASTLHVPNQLPRSIPLQPLQGALGPLHISFSAAPERNLQRQTMGMRFSEIWLSPVDAMRLHTGAVPTAGIQPETLSSGIGAALIAAITPQALAQPGTDAYRPPPLEQLLRIEREVLTPLCRLAQAWSGAPDDNDAAGQRMLLQLNAAAVSADAVGIDLRWLSDGRRDYFVLADREQYSGWIALRAGAASNFLIEAPRPLSEAGTLELAISAFDTLQARALIIAGAVPDANRDGSADVLSRANDASLFTLAHQVALREMGDTAGAALMVRALSVRPDQVAPGEDAVLALDLARSGSSFPDPVALLFDGLQRMGLNVRIDGGQEDAAGLEAAGGPAAAYMAQTRNKRFAVLWASPAVRRGLDTDSVALQRQQFSALGLPSRQTNIVASLAQYKMAATHLPPDVKALAEKYQANNDVVLLANLHSRFPELRLERLEDNSGRGTFLLIRGPDQALLGALALSARPSARKPTHYLAPGPILAADAGRFVASRAIWMVAP